MEFYNIQSYIDYVERGIKRAKSHNHNNYGDFEVKFSEEVMSKNAKIYFESKGYSVEVKECHQCKSYDIIYSWENK